MARDSLAGSRKVAVQRIAVSVKSLIPPKSPIYERNSKVPFQHIFPFGHKGNLWMGHAFRAGVVTLCHPVVALRPISW